MADFKKLELKRFPRVTSKDDKEVAFWNKFKHPIVAKEYGTITKVDFSLTPPHDFAVTAGTRVQIYSSVTSQVKKTISRFQKTAYCGKFRQDSKLLAAGGEEAIVRVFDIGSRAILRELKGHGKSVRCVDFTSDSLKIVSGSDDTSARLWDMATGTSTRELRGHTDYLRAVAAHSSNTDIIVTGSYDHTVRVWDTRSDSTPIILDHGAPVEALLVFPSGGSCISAGGNFIKVWDLLTGGRILAGFSNHQKTITSLGFDGKCHRLLSGGLDRHLKIYDLESYKVKHSILYSAPILSLALSPSDDCLAVGMTDQLLSIRNYPKTTPQTSSDLLFDLPDSAPLRSRNTPVPGTHRYFMRGKNDPPDEEDFVVLVGRHPEFNKHDKLLKEFKYKEALNSVLKAKNHPQKPLLIYSVLRELNRRDGLNIALSGRNEEELLPLLDFFRRHLTNPRYLPFLMDVCDVVLDIYGHMCFTSKPVQRKFEAIRAQITDELKCQETCFEIMGMIETLMCASMANNRTRTADNTTK